MCARPRAAEDPVLTATVDLIAEHGIAGVTVDTIAASAGVSKATIYRHWGSRAQLIHAAFSGLPRPSAEPDTGTLRGDLVSLLGQLVDYLRSPQSGAVLSSLADAAGRDPALATLQRELLRVHRAAYERAIQRGIARGELAPTVDAALLTDLLVSPLVYRRLIAHTRVRPIDIPPIVDTVLTAAAANLR